VLATANGDDVRRDMIASIGILRRAHSTVAEGDAWNKDPDSKLVPVTIITEGRKNNA
jgi:hypothetical protein